MTPTGRATGRELFGDGVTQSWLPWDHGAFVRRFLDRARPDLGVLLETEIWPNLLAECRAGGVPVFLVNARLSARSAAGYARLPSLAREALGNLAGVAAQTTEDASRLEALGARDVAVTGNIKFDLAVPGDTARAARRFAPSSAAAAASGSWAARATGEEALLVEAIEAARPPADVLVVDRAAPSAAVRGSGAAARRARARSAAAAWAEPVPAQARYALGDSMGEMLDYYAAADVVFVGGSLKPLRRAEPDRALRRRAARGLRAAHLQLRERRRGGPRRGRGAARARRGARGGPRDGAARRRRTARGDGRGAPTRFAQANRGALDRLARLARAAPAR